MDWNELQMNRRAGTQIDDVALIKTNIIAAAIGPSFLDGEKRIKAWVEADAALTLCDSFEEAVSYLQQKVFRKS